MNDGKHWTREDRIYRLLADGPKNTIQIYRMLNEETRHGITMHGLGAKLPTMKNIRRLKRRSKKNPAVWEIV